MKTLFHRALSARLADAPALLLFAVVLLVGTASGCATTTPPAADPMPDEPTAMEPETDPDADPMEEPANAPDSTGPTATITPVDPPREGDDWLMQYLSREVELPPVRDLDPPDGLFSARVAARPPQGADDWTFQQLEGGWFVSLDLGTNAPAECWIYDQEKDLGAALVQGSEGVFGYLERTLGGLEDRRLYQTTAGAFDDQPHLGVEWLYRTATEDPNTGESTSTAGHVKHLVVGAGAGTVYCMHNEIGYRQTFTDLVRDLAASLEVESDKGLPFYQEVHALRVGGEPVGLEQIEMRRDDDGDVEITQRGSLLLADGEGRLSAQDSLHIEWSTPDGFLINAVAVEAQNGRLSSEVRLKPVETGTWKVEGNAGDREVSAEFSESELRSDIGERILLRRLLSGDETELTYQAWLDVGDVTQAQTVLVAEPVAGDVPPVIAEAEGSPVRTEMGGLNLVSSIDDTGSPVRVLASLGDIELTIDRVFVQGESP